MLDQAYFKPNEAVILNPFALESNPTLLKYLTKLIDEGKKSVSSVTVRQQGEGTAEYLTSQERLSEILKDNKQIYKSDERLSAIIPVTPISRQYLNKIEGLLWTHFRVSNILNTGHFFYPKHGFLGWHTNSDHLGIRIYMTYVEVPNQSAFIYLCPYTNEIVWSWDKTGWTIRMFDTSDQTRPLWHAVWSNTERYSFGFTIN